MSTTFDLKLENLTVTPLREDIANVRLDMPGKSANIINESLQDDLERALNFLEQLSGLKGVLLTSGKEKIFVAGADLNAIAATLDWPDENIHQFCFRGQQLFNRFQELPCVSVAAIHGACVGGGLELALGCHFQIAAKDRQTILGLPETKLGLIPGWAGTVRLPRLVGLERAIELIGSSQLFSADQAVEMGLIEQAVAREHLLEAAIRLIDSENASSRAAERKRRQHSPLEEPLEDRGALARKWEASFAQRSEIFSFAPQVLAQHMIDSADDNFSAACESEARAMAQVYGSGPSRGLLNQFFLNERIRKQPGWVGDPAAAHEVERVGILGAGVMGSAIAREALRANSQVVLADTEAAAVEQALQEGNDKLRGTNRLDELADADLILECITEQLSLKRSAWQGLFAIARPDALLASNTSACPLEEVFQGAPQPERCCGIHYCHPELMQLVEVVRLPATSDRTVATAMNWLKAQRKTALVVKNAPGFVVNRILTAMLDAALAVMTESLPFERVDQAMRQFGFRGGPFEIMDTIGLDTVVNAGRAMAAQGVRQVSRSPILPMLARKKRWGRKSGCGFYRYATPTGVAEHDLETTQLLEPYRLPTAEPIEDAAVCERILAAMLLAATEVVAKGVVADPRHVDVAMIQGLGFPGHHGGLLFWADQQGANHLRAALEWNAQRYPAGLDNSCLAQWLQGGTPFYGLD